MRPLRVLYLIDSLGLGGAQRQLVTLVRSLDRASVEPEVAIYHQINHFRPELEASGTRVHSLEGSGGRDPRVLFGLARLLARGRYDIVHTYLNTPGALARLALLFSRRTCVVVSLRSVDLGHSRSRLTLERILGRRGDTMIVNAEVIARDIERLVPSWKGRLHVVPNGVGFREPTEDERAAGRSFRAAHARDASCLLGVVARVGHEKAPDLLLDALELVPEQQLRRLRIVWVGPRTDARLAAAIEARLAGSALGDRMEFLGETINTREVYLGLDGLVLCSRWEGLPNVVLEALAHGCPVIGTDVGDTGKLLRDRPWGWLVPPDDAGSLANALCRFVDTRPEDLVDAGRLGAEFVLENYSVARLVERTLDVYRAVMRDDRPGAVASRPRA